MGDVWTSHVLNLAVLWFLVDLLLCFVRSILHPFVRCSSFVLIVFFQPFFPPPAPAPLSPFSSFLDNRCQHPAVCFAYFHTLLL
eukprot:m.294502 g.294502  ORF g.294502 m.294502 type:complete len:84 (-) comp13002_c0_seq1:26-277(-)